MCRGMTAELDGVRVFVLDAFLRRGVLHADVGAVLSGSAEGFTLGSLSTVKAASLTDVRLELCVTQVHGQQVRLEAVGSQNQCSFSCDLLPISLPSLSATALQSQFQDDLIVVPHAAALHTHSLGTGENPHRTSDRSDRAWVGWVLDIPKPCVVF